MRLLKGKLQPGMDAKREVLEWKLSKFDAGFAGLLFME